MLNDRDIFELVTLESVQKDSAAIMKVFSDVRQGIISCDVWLLNYYRLLPVSYKAVITDVMGDRIDINAHENQVVVMKHEKYTLIKCEYFPQGLGVHAYVALSNINRGRAILTRFSYAQIKSERRGSVRVKIESPLEAQFISNVGTLTGNLEDISISGASLRLSSKLAMELNVDGRFVCILSGETIDVPARLVKSLFDDYGNLAIVTIQVYGKIENLISQFIFSLQVSVIRKLKEQYV